MPCRLFAAAAFAAALTASPMALAKDVVAEACAAGTLATEGFDVCGDQTARLAAALARARASDKLVLVEVMASWCPSCPALRSALADGALPSSPALAGRFERIEIVTSTLVGRTPAAVPAGVAAFAAALPDPAQRAAMRGWPYLVLINPHQPLQAVGLNTDRLTVNGTFAPDRLKAALEQLEQAARGAAGPPADSPPGLLERAWRKVFGS